jgi:hypothetical protein
MQKPFSPSSYSDDISDLPYDLLVSEVERLQKSPISYGFETKMKIMILKATIEMRKRLESRQKVK